MNSSLYLRFPKSFIFILFTLNLVAQGETFTRTQIGANNILNTPNDLDFGPDGYLWITERKPGIVVRINPENGKRDELLKLGDVYSTASQDGLLGIALADGILSDNPYLYLSYTYFSQSKRRQRIVRYTYKVLSDDGFLTEPLVLIEGLPASNDHNSGKVVIGPDKKIYYTIGDQGGNQNANFCIPILSQNLPTQAEVDTKDWSNYPGKILRMNLDGSIPSDNPTLNGVRSHIYSYGHRNAQGLVFGKNGILYSDEHGPETDDEVNIIEAGMNYGWPRVVGYNDNQAYDYCNWSTAANCSSIKYDIKNCPVNATLLIESSFSAPNYRDPLFAMFAVDSTYNFNNPTCQNSYTCRPNVAPSSLAIYESDAIKGWKNSLLVTSLKRGQVYRLKLDDKGTKVLGDTFQLFYNGNRYRDIAISPDGKSLYCITDQSGNITDASGFRLLSGVVNPGAIFKFTFNQTVDTKEEELEKSILVYPNPATKTIRLIINYQKNSNLNGTLYSPIGEIVKQYPTLQAGDNELDIDLLPMGIYTLKLANQSSRIFKRVIIH